MINKKIVQALSNGLVPVLCVGESVEERTAGTHRDRVQDQLIAAFTNVRMRGHHRLMVAYEPIWAIGTGHTPEVGEVIAMHEFIRGTVLSKTQSCRGRGSTCVLSRGAKENGG